MREKEKYGSIDASSFDYFETVKPHPHPAQAEEKPKETEKFNRIGSYTPRIDGDKIVTGQAPYTHDIKLRGMLTGKILRSPHAAAEIISIDTSKAENLPGVKAVLKLNEDKVRYAGQQVAAVAAVDEYTAARALALIEVQYKTLPHSVTEENSREPDAPQVLSGANVQQFNQYDRGDIEAGFKQADIIREFTYRTPVEIHHPTETHSSIARWQGDRLTIWDSTQAIHSVRDGLARTLKIPAARIKVIKHYMGGGFGSKLSLNEHTVAAAQLAKISGHPVKIVLTREENALCVGNRPSSHQTYKGGVKKDGTLTALSLVNYTNGGINRGDRCSEPMIDLYKCPNVKDVQYTVFTNLGPSRAMRAPGHVQGTFGLEGFLDELATAINMDPMELRLKNYSSKNQGDTGIPYSSKHLEECYRTGAKEIGWERRNKVPGEGTGRYRRGMGVASQIWWGAGVPGTLADVKIHPDGSIEVICGTQDIGCGTRTYMATIAAETLGLKPEDIIIKIGNSDYPWAPISGGSLTTPSVAPATRDASLKAAGQLKQMAAEKLEISPEDIELKDGRLVSKTNPDKSVTLREMARSMGRETVFHGSRSGMPSEYAYNSFGAHFAEVEVDTLLGKIKVIKMVAVHDIGRVINRQTAESQVVGGITQGLGTALFERRIVDQNTGRLVNPNLRDYKIPTSLDMPEIVALFIDKPDPYINNLGTKGLGEPPRIPSSAVIANAVYNAIGVHLREIPMTPDKVLNALKQKEAV